MLRLRKTTLPCWALAGLLAIAAMAGMVLEAVILDFLARRTGPPMSVTTLLPGLVYASATVVKVCLACSLILAIACASRRLRDPGAAISLWGTVSFALTASAPLIGALVAVITQWLIDSNGSVASRYGVLTMLAMIGAAAVLAARSLLRREHPAVAPAISLVMNVVLVALFVGLNFQAPWFHQDTWAAR